MRALVQRVQAASVTVDKEVVGQIGPGLVVFLGVSRLDTREDTLYIASKALNLRVFPDEEGRFNLSAMDTSAELLIISQFTLYGDTRRGRRPSFADAAPPEYAKGLLGQVIALFRESGLRVETGRFQAHMLVSVQNDGPVTIILDSADIKSSRKS